MVGVPLLYIHWLLKNMEMYNVISNMGSNNTKYLLPHTIPL